MWEDKRRYTDGFTAEGEVFGWEMLCRGVIDEEWIPTLYRRVIEGDQQWIVFAKQEPPECHCKVSLERCHTLEEALMGASVSNICIFLYQVSGKPSPKYNDSLSLYLALFN